eukprot:TRINITY_DN21370_c0_g3_i1.p1 TRINITY_DN21370_c0_g3~~TRINITY_DN21370_c0_g3_i1.p1  ORF type:complete len:1047 (-),score=161.39 TRINITY_DN21370_c0_g3_i1:115-2847(-)
MVSHRGFHCTSDRTRRPVENTLPAYEQAWSSGFTYCECDIQLTSDGYLVLNHDEDMARLAMLKNTEPALPATRTVRRASAAVANVSFKDLISRPTKSGVRQPLLKEVLESARSLETGKLVIEVKPGGHNIAQALVDFFTQNPLYLGHVAVIMSFDPDVVFEIARRWPSIFSRPKILLLTTKKSVHALEPYEQLLDFDMGDVRDVAEKLITRDGVRLDGVYVEWTEKLVGASKEWLAKLCEQMTVGMWQNKGEPDCLGVCAALTRLGVSFVNTDFPRGFLREYIGKAQPEDRLPQSLFASVVPALDGSAGGIWQERPSREQNMQRLKSHEFDILIIGGGATGVGTALEAMRQGYSVALVERGDFGCGTSSKSSNMIHGGIRYLQAFVNNPEGATEQMNVVKKGLAEQNYMYNCAPYNVRPCPFMVACYTGDDKESYGKLLKKYDELGSDDPFPESSWHTKKETLFRFPQLRQEGLVGSFVYYDGQQDDARMAILIALTAVEGGATVCNYLEVQSLVKSNGVTRGVRVKDVDGKSGDVFNIRAKVVVNATGPFTDAIRKMDGGESVPDIIKPAAGTHVVLPDHFSPDRTGLAILETSDGRAMFYLPWMGQTIVGTTDHLSEIKPLLAPPVSDIEWIIKEVNRYLNPHQTPAKYSDVLAAWVGIRPLAQGLQSATGTKDTEAAGGGAGDTKSVPREHAVLVSDSKLVTITGGKWTSYRHMAEDTLKEVIKVGKLKSPHREWNEHGPTFEQGFVGTKAGANKDYMKLDLACAAPFHSDVVELRKKWRFSRDISENLVASYGTHAIEVACIARRGEKMGFAARLADGYPWIMAQVIYAVRREYARSVPDVISRRTRLAQVDVLAAYDALPKIVDCMAEELEWDEERVQAEVANAVSFLESCGLSFCQKQRVKLQD